eukprot:jgi/Galph1/4458/GphlegSOOS_G3114.1
MSYIWNSHEQGIRYVAQKPYFSKQDETIIWHKGQCHCGNFQFEVEAPKGFVAIDCDCSVCVAKGILHLMVPAEKLRLTSDCRNPITTYQFNTKVAKHTFCSVCGIHPFCKYSGILSEVHCLTFSILDTPRCNPESISVNVRCLNQSLLGTVSIEFLDGKNFSGSLPLGENGVYFLQQDQKKDMDKLSVIGKE